MQPAVAELVQNLIFPASAARASARLGARMSIPWCGPPGLGAPKSSMYSTGPSTGKTIVCGGCAGAAGTRPYPAVALPATRVTRPASVRARVPRVVVRKRVTGGPKGGTLAEGPQVPPSGGGALVSSAPHEDRGLRQVRA